MEKNGEDKGLWRKLLFLPVAIIVICLVWVAIGTIYELLIPPGKLVPARLLMIRYFVNEVAIASFSAYAIGMTVWRHKISDVVLLVVLGLIIIFESTVLGTINSEPYVFVLYALSSGIGLLLARNMFYSNKDYDSFISGESDDESE